jgi:hypothetical protein
VQATSTIAGAWFFFYLAGSYLGRNQSGAWTFSIPAGATATVSVLDGSTNTIPSGALIPIQWPATRTLFWNRSIDPNIAAYQVQQQTCPGGFSDGFSGGFESGAGSGWQTLAIVPDDAGQWDYSYATGPLDDLTNYQWQIVPLDAGGNPGDAVSLSAELIVRTPDAPMFTVAVSGGVATVSA